MQPELVEIMSLPSSCGCEMDDWKLQLRREVRDAPEPEVPLNQAQEHSLEHGRFAQ